MNVFEKLQNARIELQEMNLKKSGFNKFANYSFFELGDFLPAINSIFAKYKLFSQINFTNEDATLIILNTEKPEEKIIFTSPMAEAELKGCHKVQNLGASQSYLRRYLYMSALEIVESDALDNTTGQEKTQNNANKSNNQPKASDKQLSLIQGKIKQMATKLNSTQQEILQKLHITKIEDLTSQQASALIPKLMEWEKQNK